MQAQATILPLKILLQSGGWVAGELGIKPSQSRFGIEFRLIGTELGNKTEGFDPKPPCFRLLSSHTAVIRTRVKMFGQTKMLVKNIFGQKKV